MRVATIAVTMIVALCSIPGVASAQGWVLRGAESDTPAITAAGTSVVRVQPNRAVLFVTITPELRSVGPEALAEVSGKGAELKTALEAAGVAASAVSPWGLGVAGESGMNQMGSMQPAAVQGWRIVIEDLERLSEVAELSLLSGATEVSGALYEAESTKEQRMNATTAAFRNAHAEAEALAAAAGGSLGRLLTAHTTPDYTPFTNSQMLQGGMGGGRLIPNDLTVRVQVQATWELIPG